MGSEMCIRDSNQPVKFSAGEARWKSPPNTRLTRELTQLADSENISSLAVRIKVDSGGNITGVSITRSSGNAEIDRFIKQRIAAAKLYPFTRDGNAVAGSVDFNISL